MYCHFYTEGLWRNYKYLALYFVQNIRIEYATYTIYNSLKSTMKIPKFYIFKVSAMHGNFYK